MDDKRNHPKAPTSLPWQKQGWKICLTEQQWRRIFGGGVAVRIDSIAIVTLSFLSVAPCITSAATSDGNTCPPNITTNQTLGGAVHDGWAGYGANGIHPFTGVSFFLGPPDQKALLAPSSHGKKGKHTVATWSPPKSELDYWVACEYAGTRVVLAKKLASNVDACVVTYDNQFTPPIVKNWNCQTTATNEN